MNKEAYKLANEIGANWEPASSYMGERLDRQEAEKYKEAVMGRIRAEHNRGLTKRKGKTRQKSFRRGMAAAACAAALVCSVAVFGEEVHAAIAQISWSISSALGLSKDLAAYRNVVRTSETDKGYVITLQEVVAAEGKVVVNYTLQREDGEAMEAVMIPIAELAINGKKIYSGSSGGGRFLDEEHTVTGVDMSYDVDDIDMAQENQFRLTFHELDVESDVKGKWEFQFYAEGADLIADTVRIPIQKEFVIEDGVSVTLEELSTNELEQRIGYHIEGSSTYIVMVQAEDDTGRKIQFSTRRFDGRNGDGYMQNEEMTDGGRIADNAGSVSLTLYATKLPEESGQMSHDYVQIGETIEVDIP
ncbi:MAG: DUF4179 domain-containing protein [Lachnospiraceae bacterium]|nr:DUF4179 domain-containing protein [Lachnospiraceae bacterium]